MLLTVVLAALPDPASAESVGWLLLSLAALAVAGKQGWGLIEKFKSVPSPGDISEDRIKAIEKRMHNIELRMENHMGAMTNQMTTISETLTNMQSDWSYAIGRIDGRHETSK